jgi:hypothetical protein
MEDRNSFREIMRERECSVCPDIINEMERHIEKQAKTFSVLSKVVELFVPNALDTAARIIGGDNDTMHRPGGPSDEPGGSRGMGPHAQAGWRKKPS